MGEIWKEQVNYSTDFNLNTFLSYSSLILYSTFILVCTNLLIEALPDVLLSLTHIHIHTVYINPSSPT